MKLIERYQNDPTMLEKFHEFIAKIFPGAKFKEWQNLGFWHDNYVPFSLVYDSQIVSNVCVAEMELVVNGKTKRGIQIGAVGTLPEYRNNGFSKQLMEYVLKIYDSVDLMLLYANDSVLDFYPRFGFKNYTEAKYEKIIREPKLNSKLIKLDINNASDYQLLINSLNSRCCLTKIFGAYEYSWITMWHVLNNYKDHLYYLDEYKLIAVLDVNNHAEEIIEVFSPSPINLDIVLNDLIISNQINRVVFNFPPDQYTFEFDNKTAERSLLFIRGNVGLVNGSFKFPISAVT